MRKKLIEVALPLEAINEASAREKSIRHGHPSTLHLWWARRPLATARAVLFASLVDDPSSRPDLYPTVELQNVKREKLFKLIEELVLWENSSNADVLNRAREEIMASTDGKPPEVLDPFAGGGTIPLEAQRLGLRAHAFDLNPVAVMINKAMLEIPARFKDKPPVNPAAREKIGNDADWHGALGLAADVEYYGKKLKSLAEAKIGCLYPSVELEDGSRATVIAWIWARTVRCSNPACRKIMPLVHSFELSKKQGVSVEPIVDGEQVRFEIGKDVKPTPGTINRRGAKCIHCGSDVRFEYIRAEGKADRLGRRLMAIVAEGKRGRIYLAPNDEHVRAADVPMPDDTIDAPLPDKALGFAVQNYGIRNWNRLFTARQLTALTTFSDLIGAVWREVVDDCSDEEYANAVVTYLAFVIDKITVRNSTICIWDSGVKYETIMSAFGRQAVQMRWDYAEGNPFSNSSGCFDHALDGVVENLKTLTPTNIGDARQHDANKPLELDNVMISSDPPYYDNVPYSDLSDFFYVWMRRSLRHIYPRMLMRALTPKLGELISDPNRHGGKEAARNFFENGMLGALRNIYAAASTEYPISIYYAYKQDDSSADDERLSVGWETMLRAIIDAGFIITGTLPMRTELTTALKATRNALSTSIVIVCRKQSEPKPSCMYNKFMSVLSRELEPRLVKLQASNLLPTDMAQAAIGPGMEIYSRYSEVLRSNGERLNIRDALIMINRALDDFLGKQDSDLDDESKFCLELYKQAEFGEIKFGDAQVLATAKNVSLTRMKERGIIESGRGLVRLLTREELKDNIDAGIWVLTQRVMYWVTEEGSAKCAAILLEHEAKKDLVKRLAYRLYNISERRKHADEALCCSRPVESWHLIESELLRLKNRTGQLELREANDDVDD